MARKELEEIKSYWGKKYPNVLVTLFSSDTGNQYYGRMAGASATVDLRADTIGELISQGEAYLRKLK